MTSILAKDKNNIILLNNVTMCWVQLYLYKKFKVKYSLNDFNFSVIISVSAYNVLYCIDGSLFV